MATFSDARSVYGLSATGTPSSTNVSGTVQVGISQTQERIDSADIAYSLRAVITDGSTLTVDLTNGSSTGSTAWVAGTQQVETATVNAAGGITSSGNATVVVTASGMTGSPKTISVPVTTTEHTSAALIAAAIVLSLNADTAYSALFTATADGVNVVSKANSIWSGTPALYPADVANHNISIANGTCTGITTASTSTATTTGVASSGTKVYDGDAKDIEGADLASINQIKGIMIQTAETAAVGALEIIQSGWAIIPESIMPGQKILMLFPDALEPVSMDFTADGGPADITITVIGITTAA